MTDIMMQIGDYPFSIDTAAYDQMKRKSQWRWAEQDRFGRNSALQFTGVGSEEIRLSGVILPAWRGGTGQVDDMRAEAAKGEPLILVDGLGHVWGDYVITSIEEAQSHLTAYGVGRKVRFEMVLKYYGEDAPLPVAEPEQ